MTYNPATGEGVEYLPDRQARIDRLLAEIALGEASGLAEGFDFEAYIAAIEDDEPRQAA